MHNLSWKKIILSILILTILIGSSGCQSDSPVAKDIKNTIDAFAQIPDKIGRGITNLISGIGDIGGALTESIRNIVGGMTGK